MKPRAALLAAIACIISLSALAQAPASTTFTGCAMPLEGHPDFLTLCEPHTCSLLRGKVDTHWAGHTVILRGVLHPATSSQPRTVEVTQFTSLGAACKAVCKPSIPGRGIGPKDKPDGEGGTPGADQKDPQ